MADQPEIFVLREVKGYFTARVDDSSDADPYLDRVMLQGNATLVPNFRGGFVVATEAGEHIVPQTLHARIVDGHLLAEVVDEEETILQPLYLPVTVDDRMNQNWSWTLRFTGVRLGELGEDVTLPDLSFPVEDGEGPLELSTVAQTVVQRGAFITRGAPGAGLQDIIAEDGQITFSWDDGKSTSIDVPDAVPGPPGDDGAEGPRGPEGLQGPAGAGDGFPLVVDDWTEASADSLVQSGLYRLAGSYPKGDNGWPAAIEGMAASVIIRRLWSGLVHQEVRGWSASGGTLAYTRWLRIGSSGTTGWVADASLSAGDRTRIDRAFQARVSPPTLDLDLLLDPGQYMFNSGSYATEGNHFPQGAWGNQCSVIVYTIGSSGAWKVQEVTSVPTLANKSRKFYRQYRDGWGEWFELATTGEAHNTPGMFGARGDGVRDDTASMQAWIDEIASRGYGTLPPGIYRITSTLTVSSDVRISGAGGEIHVDGDFTAIESTDGDFTVEFDKVHIRGTLGDGSVPSLSGQRGMNLTNHGHVSLTNCKFTDIHEICVRIHNAETWAITGSVFTNYGYCGAAVYTHGAGGTFQGNIMEGTGIYPGFSNNTYAFTATHLNETYRPARVIVQGNVIRNQAWEALDTHGGTEMIFDSNIIQGAEAGIVVTPRTEVPDSSPSNITISNNIIDAGDYPEPRQGVSIAGSNATGTTVKATGIVIGNTITGYGRRDSGTAYFTGAMHMTRAEYVTITGNYIIDPFGAACRFRAADNCVFSGNTVRNIVAEPNVDVPRRFAQAESDVSLTMQNNVVLDTGEFVPLYQNTSISPGTVTARGYGNSWDDLPVIGGDPEPDLVEVFEGSLE